MDKSTAAFSSKHKYNSAAADAHVLTLGEPAPKHCNELISEKRKGTKKNIQKKKPTEI
jgi:hypothetical protein